MQDPTQNYLDLAEIARLGEEMERVLKSDAFKAGMTLARARLFEEWTRAVSPKIRERLHAEQRALDRVLDAFKTIDEEGVVAREARRRIDESYTDLSEEE